MNLDIIQYALIAAWTVLALRAWQRGREVDRQLDDCKALRDSIKAYEWVLRSYVRRAELAEQSKANK